MFGLYTNFAGLSADEMGPPAPAGSIVNAAGQTIVPALQVAGPQPATGYTADQIAALGNSIFGMFDATNRRKFELQMAQLNAQQQLALAQQTAAKHSTWATPLTIGAIAVAGIVGIMLISSLRKR